MPEPAALFASILFGAVGTLAFLYGWKKQLWRPAVIGLALGVFPYFVSGKWALYLLGFALCAALVFWRE